MKIDINYGLEINGIAFGSSRNDVRIKFGKYEEFKKTKESKNTVDDFGFCHAFYNERNELIAVEIFDDSSVYQNDKKIFPISIMEAKKIFNDLKEEEDSYISIENSIGYYALNGKMESILVGIKGYYE